MASFDIPLFNEPAFAEDVPLGTRLYRLRFYYNSRTEAYYFDILDQNGVILAAGRKISSQWAPVARFVDDRLPEGLILAIDDVPGRQKPGIGDLDNTFHLEFTPSP